MEHFCNSCISDSPRVVFHFNATLKHVKFKFIIFSHRVNWKIANGLLPRGGVQSGTTGFDITIP